MILWDKKNVSNKKINRRFLMKGVKLKKMAKNMHKDLNKLKKPKKW